MVEMQVREHHVRHLLRPDTQLAEPLAQIKQAEETIIPHQLPQLLVARPVVDHDHTPLVRAHDRRTHGQHATIQRVAPVAAAPGRFGNRAEHGAPVRVEITGVYQLYIHKDMLYPPPKVNYFRFPLFAIFNKNRTFALKSERCEKYI